MFAINSKDAGTPAAQGESVTLVDRRRPGHRAGGHVDHACSRSRFNNQPYWAIHHKAPPQLLWQFLPQAGPNMEQLRSDMNNPEIAKRIAQDLAVVAALIVRMTPVFFVNGKALPRFGYDQLKELVEVKIKANY